MPSVSIIVNDPDKYHGDYRVLISDSNGYIGLQHLEEYKIRLRTDKRSDVQIKIDGKSIGQWRVSAYCTVDIERPVNEAKKLVFVKEDSTEAKDGELVKGDNKNGLIEVIFKAEKEKPMMTSCYSFGGENDNTYLSPKTESYSRGITKGFSAGGTVLGSTSNQRFNTTAALDEYETPIIIKYRLVCIDKEQKKYTPLRNQSSTPPPIV